MDLSDFLPLLKVSSRNRIAERACAKGEHLFRRGDAPRFLFYVHSGEAHLVRSSPSGMVVVLQRVRRGFLAEASLEQSSYHCDGVAVQSSRLLAIPVAVFRAALSQDNFRALWTRHLSRELWRARAHSERLALRSASDRIVHFIETEGSNGTISLTQDKKSWAAEIGLTHEALYRALRVLKERGILDIAGPRIRLRSPQEP